MVGRLGSFPKGQNTLIFAHKSNELSGIFSVFVEPESFRRCFRLDRLDRMR